MASASWVLRCYINRYVENIRKIRYGWEEIHSVITNTQTSRTEHDIAILYVQLPP